MTHTCQSYGRRQITVLQVFIEPKGRLQTREGETHIEKKRRHRLQCGLNTERESRGGKIQINEQRTELQTYSTVFTVFHLLIAFISCRWLGLW